MSEEVFEGEVVSEATAIVVREETALAPPPSLFSAMRPAEKLEYGREVATVLRDMLREGKIVIDENGKEKRVPLIKRIPQKKDGRIIGYNEHVEVEGWQTCAMLCNATIIPRWAKANADGDYDAYAEVVTIDGRVIGGGQGHCDRKERRWAKSDNYAIESMAQTRSQGRAGRSVFAWIMVLAGFSPTPAPEVPDGGFNNEEPPPPPAPPTPIFDRQRAQNRIFVLVQEYAKLVPAVLSDDPDMNPKERLDFFRHNACKELYGNGSLTDLTDDQVKDFTRRLQSKINKAKGAANAS